MKEAAFQLYRKQWVENGAPVHTPTDFPKDYHIKGKVKAEIVIRQFERLELPIDNLDFVDCVSEEKNASNIAQNHGIWMMDEERKGATDKQIKQAEKQLGIKLPASYVELLKIQNGGYIQFETFPTDFPTTWAEDHIQVNELYGIGTESSLLDSPHLIVEWGLPKNIVLISGDGHIWIALDYRNQSENPPVILLDEEGAGVRTLAPNFESFINGLTVDEPMDWADYVLYEANQLDEETKQSIADGVRKDRSNEEIKNDIDEVVASGMAEQIEVNFSQIIQIHDRELELHMMKQILNHDQLNVRESVAEHLAACAIREKNSLTKKDVKEFLVAMEEKEANEHIRYLIELGLEKLKEDEQS